MGTRKKTLNAMQWNELLKQPCRFDLGKDAEIIDNICGTDVIKLEIKPQVFGYYMPTDSFLKSVVGYKSSPFCNTNVNKNVAIIFPEMVRIMRNTVGDKSVYNNYILIDENVVTKLANNEIIMLKNLIDDGLLHNTFCVPFAAYINANKAANLVSDYYLSTLQEVNNTQDNTNEQTVLVDSEVVTITGQLPFNYEEIINGLNLKELYGSRYADEIEQIIRQVITSAQYSVKVPVREITKEVIKTVEKESFKTTTYEELYKVLKEQTKEINDYINFIDNKAYLFDSSKIHDFINAVEEGCISLNTDKSISPDYLRNRLTQAACYMEYTEPKYKEEYPDEPILRLIRAKEINEAKPGTFYLGDELVAKFLVSNIRYPEANYDYSSNNYIPLLSGKYEDGTMYNGLINRDNYIGMLSQNMTILYPGLQKSEIRSVHYETLMNYCNNIIRSGSK